MKPLFTLLVCLLCSQATLQAQNGWFDNNPQWINYLTLGFSGDGFGYAMVTGDTMVDGISAKKIERSLYVGNCCAPTISIVRQQEDTIQYYYNGQFHTIYNFSLAPGDTLTTPLYYFADNYQYVIDSIGQVVINGQPLRFQRVHRLPYTSLPDPITSYIYILEKVGMVKRVSFNTITQQEVGFIFWQHFFFPELNQDATDGLAEYFCHYQNDAFVYDATDKTCNGVVATKEIIPGDKFTISPNPFTNYLSILPADHQKAAAIYLYNLAGQKVQSVLAPTQDYFNTAELPSGLYFLEIISATHERSFYRVIKP